MNKNKNKKTIILVLSLIAIALTLIILSNTVSALTYRGVDSTNDIAYLAKVKTDYFMELTAGKLFAPNARRLYNRSIGVNTGSVEDIEYHSTICLYHTQSGTGSVSIVNIIDIELPGKLVVYKYHKSAKYSGTEEVGTIGEYEDGIYEIVRIYAAGKYRTCKVYFKKYEVDFSSSDLLDDTTRKQLATLTVLMERGISNVSSNYSSSTGESANTSYEKDIHYYWDKYVRSIIKSTGYLDSAFEVNYASTNSGISNSVTNAAANVNYEPLKRVELTQEPGTYTDDKGNTYIGPFKATYLGGTTSIEVNGKSAEGWATRNTDGSFNDINTGNVKSNQAFYAVIDSSELEGISTIRVKLKLNYAGNYSARIVLSKNKYANGQNLMYFAGTKGDNTSDEISWSLASDVSLRIYKQDANGNMVKKSGIVFTLYEYESDGVTLKEIGKLTTTSSGKTNTITGLEKGKKYVVKETYNNWYGYSNKVISSSVIISGSGTRGYYYDENGNNIMQAREITLQSDVIYAVRNKQQLGDIIIEKIGDLDLDGKGDTNLEDEGDTDIEDDTQLGDDIEIEEDTSEGNSSFQGVVFTLQRNGKYLQLRREDYETIIRELEVNDDAGIDLLEYGNKVSQDKYRRLWVTDQSEATKFVTNLKGQIVINNLPIYSGEVDENGDSVKHKYTIKEIANNLYGYKGMHVKDDYIEVSGAGSGTVTKEPKLDQVTFEIGSSKSVKVTITNPLYLGELEITKRDSVGNLLEGVSFTLYQAVSDDTGYIRLTSKEDATWVETISQEIDIRDYDVTYLTEAEKSNATKFITDANGKIRINGLEVYSGNNAQYAGTKYNYYLEELPKSSYGNKNAKITNVTVKYGDIENGLEGVEGRTIHFKASQLYTTYIDIENPVGLFNLTINKVDEENNAKKLEGVEFTIYQEGTGANGWIKLEGVTSPVVTSDSGLDISKYTITYVSSSDDATKFATNASGKIVINNLERYCGIDSEYNYYIREKSNTLYGYKGMLMDDDNVVVSGCEIIPTAEDNTNVNETDREVIIKPTSSSEATVTIGNSEKIVKSLEISKVNENDEPLQGVEFAIYQSGTGANGWIKLEGVTSPTKTTDSGLDISKYTVSYVSSSDDATKFVTNASGKIVINNLEIYSGISSGTSTKFNYIVRETSNTLYGYEGMVISEEDVTVTGATISTLDTSKKQVNFTIDDDTVEKIKVKVKNTSKLFKLEIDKVDENDKPLQGVEFAVYQSGTGANGWIKLEGVTSPIETTDSGLDISKYTVSYVSSSDAATKFETNSSGKIVINNLKIYSGKDTKFNYIVRETSNTLYGYKGMVISEEDVTVTGATIKSQDTSKKQVSFTIDDDTVAKITIKAKNTSKLFKLVINKTNNEGEALEGIEFAIHQSTAKTTENVERQWIQLKTKDGDIVKKYDANNGELDITDYQVEYVEISDATRFITDSSGKVVINNLEIYAEKATKFIYRVNETSNTLYGYKGMVMSENDVTVTEGTLILVDTNEKPIGFIVDDATLKTIEINVTNTPYYGNIEITKVDKDNTDRTLSGVGFKIVANENQYVQLKDANGNPIDRLSGIVTINKNNVANSTEYSVSIVTGEDNATTFVTDDNGKVGVQNLEVYSGKGTKYTYTVKEVLTSHYGYTIDTAGDLVVEFSGNETKTETLTNEQFLGGFKIKKIDKYNNDIKLQNVEFVLTAKSNAQYYIALYDQNGFVEELKGTATINIDNIANSTEYSIKYVEKQESATIFKTDDNGEILINNLEVYDTVTTTKYTYKLTEIYNPYPGYEVLDVNSIYIETQLEKGKINSDEYYIENIQNGMKITGYVWEDKPDTTKESNYDTVYDANSAPDNKLTDLYITEADGKVTKENSDAAIPVKIKLYNADMKKFEKTQPDYFYTETGIYVFDNVKIEDVEGNLINYVVVFEYDGLYYTTVTPDLNASNASKVQEVSANDTIGDTLNRNEVNNLFGEVTDNNTIVSKDGTTNIVEYNKDGHKSTVSTLNFDTITSANTNETGYSIKDEFAKLKANATKSVEGVNNVNMGIVLREQPKLALGSDIYSVTVDVNGYAYDYYYNGRQQHYENLNDDEVGVKFEQENSTNRYTRPVYSSDVQAYSNGTTTMGVSLIYKIQITNQSKTLTSVVNEIANYFDSDYTIQEIGLSLSNNTIGNTLTWSTDNITENVNVEGAESGKSYNSINISLSENGTKGLTLEAGKSKYVYIKYKVSESAIKGLLSGKSTYHNATEIMSYSTYYGVSTGVQTINNQNEYYVSTSEQNRIGTIYAGIDKASAPGNIELKLIQDNREGGETPILDTSNYEDDTSSAPSLLLETTTTRKISGTIFEDTATSESLANNEKIGDGIYSSSENTIDGVKVELYDANTGALAKYSDDSDAIATTDGKGNYTFGNNDIGILPGKYIIKYTYNNESYIVDTNGNIIKHLNVNDYKSTIITSDVIKSAINNAEITYNGTTYQADKWYIIQEANRYSDAIDNIELRNELDNEEVKYSEYKNSFDATYVMEAKTAVMEIGVEFTVNNEVQVDTTSLETMRNRVEKLENVDFGIIERPDVSIDIEKQITGLEITTQIGANIVPKGDPSNPNASMQYVKTGLDGLVSAEIEVKLLQGATLNLEYSITVTNNSQKDYTDTNYYLYGTDRNTLRVSKVEKVADYLDATMTLNAEQNSEEIWTGATAQELYDNGLISDEVYETLKTGDYHILITEQFSELVNPEDSKTVKLYATKYLATSNIIDEENHVEIIELSGGRTLKESMPGNYNPTTSSPDEPDDDKVLLQVVSPTGTTVNYKLYIIAVVATFVILVSGIVIIKKKIIK